MKNNYAIIVIGAIILAGSIACVAAETAGPVYKNLRQDEDFSYLAGPSDSYVSDRWDPIKNIDLGNDYTLSIGGQARLRFESETNKSFGSTEPTQDSFLLQRYFIHGDLRYSDWLRFFAQGIFAHINDRDRPGSRTGFEDHADIHQAFVDITVPLAFQLATVRLGRQELQYGAERLISPLDWGNTRRTFDGVKVFADIDDWRVDMFAVRPVLVDRRNLDDEDENIDFYGVYATHNGSPALSSDYYFLLLKNNNIAPNSNDRSGRRTLYTLGTRLFGSRRNWDYETELAAQFGTFAGDRVRAWMATAGGGYTFAKKPWTPRFGLMYDYASGDSDPTDGTHSTFNQHFPLGHAWLGYLDLVGRSNVHAIKAQVKVKPTKKLTAWADFHTFFADQDKDALYSAGGAASRRKGTPGARNGAGSHTFGHELDLTVKYAIDRHTTALVGWAHLWPGGFIDSTGDDDSPDLLYAQVEYKF